MRAGQPSLPGRSAARALRLVLVAAAVLLPAACSGRESERTIDLPATPVIELRPTWAVVIEPYVRLRSGPDREASISGHLRQGDVAEIVAISPVVERIDGDRHFWYQLESRESTGWALDDAFDSYGSEHRARNAARRITEQAE